MQLAQVEVSHGRSIELQASEKQQQQKQVKLQLSGYVMCSKTDPENHPTCDPR
jgi:hypothetical protein